MAVVLVFLVYSGIEFWVVTTTHQQASHLVNRYLERISLEGFLSAEDETNLINDFAQIGLTVTEINARKESAGASRVLRNLSDVDAGTLTLQVTAEPQTPPLWLGALIGGNVPGDDYRIKVGGEILSERISP